jgi:hypothetical protein
MLHEWSYKFQFYVKELYSSKLKVVIFKYSSLCLNHWRSEKDYTENGKEWIHQNELCLELTGIIY